LLRAAIYSRKSKFTGKGESIENQVEMCKKYGKNLGVDTFEIYEDEGFSAKNTDRPEFQRLISDIKRKKYTHLICYRLDRISRNVADFSKILELLNKYSVSFISIKEQFDTSNALGRAMMNISAVFAQLERETTVERIKDNLRELSKTGRWLGGPAPLGYRSIEVINKDPFGKNRKKHILESNPQEEEIPTLVFELFIKYKSFQKVSRILEERGIYSRKGAVFSRELVKQLITNPIYCIADKKVLDFLKDNGSEVYGLDNINGTYGLMPYNRRTSKGSFAPINDWIVSVGEHPGMVESELWIKCQEIVLGIKKKSSNRTGTSQEALLSGLVVCARCGSAMAPRVNRSNKYTYRYYSCNLRNKSANRCDNDSLNAYEAEDLVINNLMSLTKEELIKNYDDFNRDKIHKQSNKDRISEIKKEIDANKKAISNLVMKIAYLDNDPDLLIPFKDEIKKITDKNNELEVQLNKLINENNSIDDSKESLDDILSIFDSFKKFYEFTQEFEEKKRLINSVVKFVEWDSHSRKLNIILVGSSRQRPNPHNLPLSNRNRRNGTRRNNSYNGSSNYGKCINRRN
jgi:site-specific DNA recombinase